MLWLIMLLLTTQPKTMYVWEANGNVVTVEDERGGLYDFYGTGYRAGDKVLVFMDSKGTDSPYDDEIKAVKVIERSE